jgi:hypothetical protein
MFKKGYTMSLNRVHDTLRVREGTEDIVLYVNQDPRRLVAGLNGAQARLKSIDENTTEEEKLKIAKMFSSVLFGDEQTEKLSEFYHNDPGCIISVCGKYFSDRLAKLITKAQKKLK